MPLPLDTLSPVLVLEHPGRKPRGLDRVVGTDRRPVRVAPRLRRPAGPALRLRHHFAGAPDPQAELFRAQVHPPARRRRAGGWTCARKSSACGSGAPAKWWRRRSAGPAGRRSRGATRTGRRSVPTTRSSPRGLRPGCSSTRTGESVSSGSGMAVDTAGVERALGAMGTAFRLTRLYPPGHPAVREALRQVGDTLPAVAALGSVEWKVGAK